MAFPRSSRGEVAPSGEASARAFRPRGGPPAATASGRAPASRKIESTIRDSSPPTTTCANGRWLSLPMACENAAGISPTQATSAVIRMGRMRTARASRVAASIDIAAAAELVGVADEDDARLHRDAEQRQKAEARADAQVGAREPQRERPPSGMVKATLSAIISGYFRLPYSAEDDEEDEQQRQRHDHQHLAPGVRGSRWYSPPHCELVAGGQVHRRPPPPSRRAHGRAEVAALRPSTARRCSASPLAIDERRRPGRRVSVANVESGRRWPLGVFTRRRPIASGLSR